jgi:hypothetical protein
MGKFAFTTLFFVCGFMSFNLEAQNLPRVWYVNVNANGEGAGTSWQDAFFDLEPALRAARRGDEIWIAEGAYFPSRRLQASGRQSRPEDERDVTFEIPRGISIFGGFKGTESHRNQRQGRSDRTIISGDFQKDALRNNNARHVMVINSSVGTGLTVLDGFTIRDGFANETAGGGLRISPLDDYIPAAYVDLVGMIFENNYASNGGALFANVFEGNIIDSDFRVNTAENSGGAIFINIAVGNFKSILNCRFLWNVAGNDGGAIARIGGSTDYAYQSIRNSLFLQNKAGSQGGAILHDSHGADLSPNSGDRSRYLYLVNNIMAYNEAQMGGAVSLRQGRYVTAFTNGRPGRARITGSRAVVLHDTVVGNQGLAGAGAYHIATGEDSSVDAKAEFFNSIIWGNQTQGSLVQNYGSELVYRSLFSFYPFPSQEVIVASPRFTGSQSNEFGLHYNSPAVEAGILGLSALLQLPSEWFDADFRGLPRTGMPELGAMETQPRPLTINGIE